MKVKNRKQVWAFLLALCLLLQPFGTGNVYVQAKASSGVVINALDYGADPTGVKDSARAIQEAFAAAKRATEDGASSVTVSFPKGEYHIYKDYAEKREYHTSNTNSIESPEKTIGLLIEDQKNFTLEGNGSLFMMHGNMMALAVVRSQNVTLHDFSWDFGVPTVSEMTVTGMGTEDGKPYTDFFIPSCFPYEIQGTTLQWSSELSPYTGQPYWTATGIHNSYGIVGYQPDEEMSRNYYTSESPFSGVSQIRKLDDTTVRILYQSARPSMQKLGMVLELAGNAYRETAGAFTWESENVTARGVNVHYMHGFGWLIQMSRDVYYYDCNLTPRENSGHVTVSFADGIHASGAAGDLVIENCNFANTHDDPINLHGTFTRVEERKDDHTLILKYIHTQQGGFPQYHVGDEVAFFTRDTLESTDGETLYTVAEVVSNPGEDGNDLRTMEIRFEEALPANLSDTVGGQPKYLAENVTYAPKVTIRGCTFQNVPTRGILCTTRNPVLIEDNVFWNMSMATIYLSNDSDEWYESGPIRDMTIRGNTFYIKSIGRTSWEYAPAIYVHPVTKGGGLPSEDNPIHKNITIEDNIFHMDVDTVVKAESVENLTIRNNTILRTNPDVSISISAGKASLNPGEVTSLTTQASGDAHTQAVDNVYEFTKCKNVVIEGNTYDDGLKRYAVLSGMSEGNFINGDAQIQTASDRNQPATDPVTDIRYASTDPDVVSVDAKGSITARAEGRAAVFAYYLWNGTIIKSNEVEVTVGAGSAAADQSIVIQGEDNLVLTEEGQTYQFTAETNPQGTVEWWVEDFETGANTDAATIDGQGLLRAEKNGIVWVKARIGQSVACKAIIISLPEAQGLNPSLTIVREDTANYGISKEQVEIDLQAGDLYESNNTLKNLFLYQIPLGISKDQMRTVIKVENMPIKESGQWDTASFLLYRDDDNYISMGKKSHYDGIASVEEIGGTATETGGNSKDNQVTEAWLGFCKQGNQVSLDYKLEDGSWQHLTDLSDTAIGDEYQIGFSGWETNDRGKKVTFSQFRVGDAALSYEELCETEAIAFLGVANQAPAAHQAQWDSDSYQVGDTAAVSYQYTDPEGDEEGRTIFRFTYEDGTEEVTTAPETVLKREGTVTCTIYPVDGKGTPGEAVSVSTQVQPLDGEQDLERLLFNGKALYENGQQERQFTVDIPAGLTKAELSYRVLGGEGAVQIFRNGVACEETSDEYAVILVEDKDEIQVKLSGNTVSTIQIRCVESNDTQIDGLAVEELGLEQEDPQPGSWFLNADSTQGQATLKIQGNSRIGEVSVAKGAKRTKLELTKNGENYTVPLTFDNGLNTYYIQVTAKDGRTMAQHLVHVNYAASTEVKLDGIRINGESLEGFEPEREEYLVLLEEGSDSVDVQVEAAVANQVKIAVNGTVTEGTTAVSAQLVNGKNEVQVVAIAADGITRETYHITVVVPYESCADIYDITVNGESILDEMQGEEAFLAIPEDAADIQVTALDDKAEVTLTSGASTQTEKGSLARSVNLYRETPKIQVTVTARDGKTVATKTLWFEKALYLSDLAYEPGATVGYGEIMMDLASSGSKISLADDQGNPVTYDKGIGTHADSEITYVLPDQGFQKLQGAAGVDYVKYSSQYASVRFTILADGETVFESGIMYGNTPGKAFEIDVTDVSQITLKAAQDSNNWDAHGDWAQMKLTGEFPEAPIIPTYSQRIVQGANGTITSSVEGELTEGESVTYTFTPNPGYQVAQALVNGRQVELKDGKYTVEKVEEDLTVTAAFTALLQKDRLETAILEAENIDLTGKTPEQVQAFREALREARELLERAEAGDASVTQSQIEEAVLKLTSVAEEIQRPVAAAEYTVTFIGGAEAVGKAPEQVKGKPGTKVTLPANPFSRSGYQFTGWLVDGKIYAEGSAYVIPERNTAVTAVWTRIPGKVSGLKMKRSKVSAITLSWNKEASASGYELQRTVKGKNQWKTVYTGSGLTFVNKKLSAGTVYTYRVRAYVSSNGKTIYGSWSKSQAASTKPKKPTLKVKVKKGWVQMTWKKNTKADKIEVWRKIGNGKFKRVKVAAGKTTKCKLKVKKGLNYTFRIRGRKNVSKGKKVYSAYSKKVKITVK